MIFVKTEQEIDLMREPCRIMRDALDYLGNQLKAGMTTADVNALADDYIRSRGAIPSCLGYCGYPASVCVSVNEQVVHGIPGSGSSATGISSVSISARIKTDITPTLRVPFWSATSARKSAVWSA